MCQTGRQYFCQAKAPNCPEGYTWLPLVGQTCFKVVDQKLMTIRVGSKDYYSEYEANKYCEGDKGGTRLATLTTNQDKIELWNWITEDGQNTDAVVSDFSDNFFLFCFNFIQATSYSHPYIFTYT